MKLLCNLLVLTFLWPLFIAAPSHGAASALYGELVKKAKAEREVEYWSPMNEDPANRILKVFSENSLSTPSSCAGSTPASNSAI